MCVVLYRLKPLALEVIPSAQRQAGNAAAERLRLMADGDERKIEIAHSIRREGQMNFLPVLGDACVREDGCYPLTGTPVHSNQVGDGHFLRRFLLPGMKGHSGVP